jgi:hypothetical protein
MAPRTPACLHYDVEKPGHELNWLSMAGCESGPRLNGGTPNNFTTTRPESDTQNPNYFDLVCQWLQQRSATVQFVTALSIIGITFLQWRINRRQSQTHRMTNQAWIWISRQENKKLEDSTDIYTFPASLKNTGNTPAFVSNIAHTYKADDKDFFTRNPNPTYETSEDLSITLLPGDSFPIVFELIGEKDIWEGLTKQRLFLYFVACVKYSDAFKSKRETRVAFRYCHLPEPQKKEGYSFDKRGKPGFWQEGPKSYNMTT